MSQGFPDKNPANSGGLPGVLADILGKFLQNVDDCLPATVMSYDREANVATVRPIVAVLTTEGTTVPRAAVASVPVLALGGGNFVVNFPLKAGDLGWIKASDRDISLFKQGLAEARPNTVRKHSFEDGFFIPDVYRQYTLKDEDKENNMVIQSLDGLIRVSLWPDRVKVSAGDETWLEVNENGVITGTAPQKIFFDTPLVEFAGIFRSGISQGGGESTMNGSLSTTGDQVAGGVSTMNHPHTGVWAGNDTSGPPVATE